MSEPRPAIPHGTAPGYLASGANRPRLLIALTLAAVFAVALALRLDVANSSSGPVISDMGEYDRIAAAMAGEIPLDDLRVKMRPAGYPLFLSAIYRAFGHRYQPAYRLQALLGALTCLLAIGAGRALGQRWPAAIAAGLALALTSELVRLSGLLLSESLFLPLAVGGLWALASSTRSPDGRREPRLQWIGGALLGASLATRSAGLYLPAAAVLWALWRKARWHQRLQGAGRIAAACSLALLAVSLVGAAAWKEWVVVDRHTSTNLWIGNNPEATGGYHFPSERPPAGIGAAVRFIRESPGRFLALSAHRFGRVWTWTPDNFDTFVDGPFGEGARHALDRLLFLLACGLATLALVRIPRERGVLLVALALAAGCTVLSITFVVPRFRIGLLPILWILAGSGMSALGRGIGWRPRFGIGGLAVIVVMLLGGLSRSAGHWGEIELLTGNPPRAGDTPVRLAFGGTGALEPAPEMHATGTGTVESELLDGLLTGTGDPTWECLLWRAPSRYVAFRARVVLDLGETAQVERVEAWTVSPYGDYRIDRVELALSLDGARFHPAGVAVNDRPRGRAKAFLLSVRVGGARARYVELTLIQHHGSGTAMPLCEVRVFGRRARAANARE